MFETFDKKDSKIGEKMGTYEISQISLIIKYISKTLDVMY